MVTLAFELKLQRANKSWWVMLRYPESNWHEALQGMPFARKGDAATVRQMIVDEFADGADPRTNRDRGMALRERVRAFRITTGDSRP